MKPPRRPSVADEIEALKARVAALEAAGSKRRHVPRGDDRGDAAAATSGGDAHVAEALAARRGAPYEKGDVRGAVVYAGALRIHGREALWEIERPLPSLLAFKPEKISQLLAAVASPQRLILLRELLAGPKSSHELKDALGLTSAGPLYHHLKELVALDLVEQPERTSYRIPPRRIVPLLAILSAAMDVGRAPSSSGDTDAS